MYGMADQAAPPRLQAVAEQYPPPGVPHLYPPSWYQDDYRAPQGDCSVNACKYIYMYGDCVGGRWRERREMEREEGGGERGGRWRERREGMITQVQEDVGQILW